MSTTMNVHKVDRIKVKLNDTLGYDFPDTRVSKVALYDVDGKELMEVTLFHEGDSELELNDLSGTPNPERGEG